IVWLDPVFVRVNVPEGLIATIKPGDTARIAFDALGKEVFEGKLDQILPSADPASRTFPVKVLVSNPKQLIRPGFFARATLLGAVGGEGQFFVPNDALVTQGEKSHVIAVREGKAVLVSIERGSSQGAKISVKGDLKKGDQVVVRGNETLRGGEPLLVQAEAPATQPQQGS